MLLSVIVPTFNHGKFIAQTIEGILYQKINFDLEILIGDDASTDDNPLIINKYATRFPTQIKAFLHKKNLGPVYPRELGGKNNVTFLFNQAKGKYIALCEGDDYWISPHKLQQQVDFLENNPSYALCHHQMKVSYEDGSPSHFFNTSNQSETSTLTDLLADTSWILGTASTVFRNVPAFQNFPEWWMKSASGDLGIFILATEYGKIKYFDEPMACYRKHKGGMTNIHTLHNLIFQKNRKEMFEALNLYFEGKYQAILEKTIAKYEAHIRQIEVSL